MNDFPFWTQCHLLLWIDRLWLCFQSRNNSDTRIVSLCHKHTCVGRVSCLTGLLCTWSSSIRPEALCMWSEHENSCQLCIDHKCFWGPFAYAISERGERVILCSEIARNICVFVCLQGDTAATDPVPAMWGRTGVVGGAQVCVRITNLCTRYIHDHGPELLSGLNDSVVQYSCFFVFFIWLSDNRRLQASRSSQWLTGHKKP